jgi:hypothetical protein
MEVEDWPSAPVWGTMGTEDLLSARQAAALLGITTTTVCDQAAAGKLVGTQIALPGGRHVWGFERAAVEEYARRYRRPARQHPGGRRLRRVREGVEP